VGRGLAKWLVLTGQTVSAEEALAIGLVDAVVPYEELDAAIAAAIASGRATDRGPKVVPDAYRPIAEFFDRYSVDELLDGRAAAPADVRLAKTIKRLGAKAPVALRLSADLIDRGATLPIEEGLALELSHLEEIFATRDAYEGLSSLGRKAPVFTGR
jgi:enoyl-CoA hydratase/carnithine racemase